MKISIAFQYLKVDGAAARGTVAADDVTRGAGRSKGIFRMSRFVQFGALLLAMVLSIASWAWLGRPIPLPDVPQGRLQCLSYTPSSATASPLDTQDGLYAVPEGLIESDLETLADVTDCVRTYSAMGRQGDVVAAAAARGMQVLLGAWISPDDAQNAAEIDRALDLAHAFPETVRMVVIGNEVLLRREQTEAGLIALLRSVRARTDVPVAYADVIGYWERHPSVATAVDVALVHVLPYWKDDPPPPRASAAQAEVRRLVERARAILPDAEIEIGEVGWPSAGRTRARAVPSRVDQARFVRGLAAEAEAIGMPYNVIEAIDQPWKRSLEGTVGGH